MRKGLGVAALGLVIGAAAPAQMVTDRTPPPQQPSMALDVKPLPLLSLDNLNFLEGTWSAEVGPNAKDVGSYAFVRDLNGHVLARRATTDAACSMPGAAVCAHRDLLYIYQDSAGAPLKAIYFDAEGHVLHYDISIRHEATAYGRRDYAIFLSEVSALGPRYRLTYERNTDTFTKKTELQGKFEVFLPNGTWQPYLQWSGRLISPPLPR